VALLATVEAKKHHVNHKTGFNLAEITASSHLNQRQATIKSQFNTLQELESLVKYSNSEEEQKHIAQQMKSELQSLTDNVLA